MEKIAIFTTSDIQRTGDTRGILVGTTSEGSEIRSTGALERALSDGYDIHVATTRDGLREGDMWWVTAVKSTQIYMAPYVSADLTGDERDLAYRKAIVSPWKRLFVRLGHDYPKEKDPRGKGLRDAYVAVAEVELSKLGYKLGRDFVNMIREEALAKKEEG